MRVAVISTPIFPCPPSGYSGLEFLAWQQAEGLAKLGHDVTLFAPDGSRCDHAKLWPFGPPGTLSEPQAYAKYWQELPKFDAVLDHTWSKWSYCLKSEGGLDKTPILAVLHAPVNTMYNVWPPHFPGYKPIEKACPVCISKDQAAHFEALHNTPARVAYNGIDLDHYQPLAIPRSNRFLFLARFSSIKGPHLAEKACRKAGVGLDLVGDTQITNEPEYFRQCQQLADGGQIRIVGGVSRGNTVWWMSQAHAFIHPNKHFREPFGLAPVEAQACGLPVIAWDNGAMRETVRHGETGVLVRSEEQLVGAISDLGTRLGDGKVIDRSSRNRCREWAANFSVQNMIKRYDELLREAKEGGGW